MEPSRRSATNSGWDGHDSPNKGPEGLAPDYRYSCVRKYLFAVQMAKHAGARVIAVTRAVNADYVRGLGADEVVDYPTQRRR